MALETSMSGHLKRILGVDLTTIPGLNVLAILTLISEIGTNMTKWRNEKAFVSWLGLSPNNKISGQRVLSSRTRKVVNRAATILRLAAMIVGKTDTPLGSFYRRKRAQFGGPKAVTATARKLGCLVYRLIKKGQGYNAPDLHIYELKYKDQILNSLRKRAKASASILLNFRRRPESHLQLQVSEKLPRMRPEGVEMGKRYLRKMRFLNHTPGLYQERMDDLLR